ncbi:hypothetical protein MPSEU_000793400 [Mayamaea pseudoterrestris]|nr:hypothetical protein MPSEU_000793400 [Mayamaea pseudoterrestris]
MPLTRHFSCLLLLLAFLIIWTIGILFGLSTRNLQAWDTSAFVMKGMALADITKRNTTLNETDCYQPALRAKALAREHVECRDKERLLDIIIDSHQSDSSDLLSSKLAQKTCRILPKFSQITSIYGKGPFVVGLETCRAYQDSVHPLMDPMPRVAGLYHSGTNALSKTLEANLGMMRYTSEYNPYEVPWGKHVPVQYRSMNKFPPDNSEMPEHVLPIVVVRHPLDWMRSMCREGYDAKWMTRPKRNCPNLFRRFGSSEIKNKVHVRTHQTGFKYTDYYDTLADMWTDWHWAYLNASFPRLLIRYEDLVLYPQQLVRIISECSGKPAKPIFRYYTKEARVFVKDDIPPHPQQSLIQALQKLGERDDMYWTMKEPSRSYALQALDPAILDRFQYQHLNDVRVPKTRQEDAPSRLSSLLRPRRRYASARPSITDQLRWFASRLFASMGGWYLDSGEHYNQQRTIAPTIIKHRNAQISAALEAKIAEIRVRQQAQLKQQHDE